MSELDTRITKLETHFESLVRTEQVERLRSDILEQIHGIGREFREQMGSVSGQYRSEIQSLMNAHRAEMSELRESHRQETQGIIMKYEHTISELSEEVQEIRGENETFRVEIKTFIRLAKFGTPLVIAATGFAVQLI